MNLIRRSISLPEDIYESLRIDAFSKRMSVNELMVDKFRSRPVLDSGDAVQKKLNDDLLFFSKVSKGTNNDESGADIIRKMRDNRSGEILSNR